MFQGRCQNSKEKEENKVKIKTAWVSICNAVRNFFRSPSMSEMTVKEIAERMKPVPYESMEDQLPQEFAKEVRRILKKNKLSKRIFSNRSVRGDFLFDKY